MAVVPEGAERSEDGRYWWDGDIWQLIPEDELLASVDAGEVDDGTATDDRPRLDLTGQGLSGSALELVVANVGTVTAEANSYVGTLQFERYFDGTHESFGYHELYLSEAIPPMESRTIGVLPQNVLQLVDSHYQVYMTDMYGEQGPEWVFDFEEGNVSGG